MTQTLPPQLAITLSDSTGLAPISFPDHHKLSTMAITKIDEIGDLSLIVGPEMFRFLVSSHALRFASPVWRAMITGPFREATAKEITFEDDDPAAMRILLLFAHLQFAKVPTPLGWNTLVSLATLCDKYNTAALVKAYGKDLMSQCQQSTSDEKLWVYWVFGYETEFKAHCSKIWKDISVDDDGEPLVRGQHLLKDSMPSVVLEPFVDFRADLVKRILDTTKTLRDNFNSRTKSCVYPHKGCDHYQVGIMLDIFAGAGSKDGLSTSSIHASLNDIGKGITEVKPKDSIYVHVTGPNYNLVPTKHISCDIQTKLQVEVAKMDMPTSRAHDKHFAAFRSF